METYVASIQQAIEVIQAITQSPDVIVHAACSGAMTATILASVLGARHDPLIYAMTLMVAVIGGSTDTSTWIVCHPRDDCSCQVADDAQRRLGRTRNGPCFRMDAAKRSNLELLD